MPQSELLQSAVGEDSLVSEGQAVGRSADHGQA